MLPLNLYGLFHLWILIALFSNPPQNSPGIEEISSIELDSEFSMWEQTHYIVNSTTRIRVFEYLIEKWNLESYTVNIPGFLSELSP